MAIARIHHHFFSRICCVRSRTTSYFILLRGNLSSNSNNILRPSTISSNSGWQINLSTCFATSSVALQMPDRPPAPPPPNSTNPPSYEAEVSNPITRKSFSEGKKQGIPMRELGFGDLIYKSNLATPIRLIKTFSISTSALALVMYPAIVHHLTTESVFMRTLIYGLFVIVTLVSPLAIHAVFRGFVVRMYYDRREDGDGRFTAIRYNIFGNRRILQFHSADARFPEIPTLLSTLLVKNRDAPSKKQTSLFINFNDISDQEAKFKIMGYDRPIAGFENISPQNWQEILRKLPREKIEHKQ